jgi:hypothetical protein
MSLGALAPVIEKGISEINILKNSPDDWGYWRKTVHGHAWRRGNIHGQTAYVYRRFSYADVT